MKTTKDFYIGREIGRREEKNRIASHSFVAKTIPEICEEYDTHIVKYVDRFGKVRVCLDLDTFRDIFEQSERQRFASDFILASPDSVKAKTPYRVWNCIEYLAQRMTVTRLCYDVLRAYPQWDERERKRD